MDLKEIMIQPAVPERHFADIAVLMNSQETEPNTAESLSEWYPKQMEDGIRIAITPEDKVLGFISLYCANLNRDRYFGVYLIVGQDFRGFGLGSMLYGHLLTQAAELEAHTMRVRVRDNCDDGIRFATKRGFVQKKHSIEMMLDLTSWDEMRHDATLRTLKAQGFNFTNLAELGDTPDSRRKLFALNNSVAATDPGSDGIPPWSSFDEFDQDVCNSSWYHPDGQIVTIDTHTGVWAALSAITVFAGSDHAYNLFTGTDVRYRGRKLTQSVKALALRKARTFGVSVVRTSHNSENHAMIAIDTKLGYVHTPGMLVMEKEL